MQTCLLPWTHLIYHTDGKVYPCCKLLSDSEYVVGSATCNIEELWNSPLLRKMRLQIKNGQLPSTCQKHCINGMQPFNDIASYAYRDQQTNFFNNTKEDGSFELNLATWVLNPSNLCNQRCLYCSKQYSVMFNGSKFEKAFNSMDEILETANKTLNQLDTIYLAGGEPYMQDCHFKLLEYLLERGKTDIEIQSMTNMSGHIHDHKDYYALLNNFENAVIVGSLDCRGQRLEFIRRGTDWGSVLENRQKLFEYSKLKFWVQATVTNLSIYDLFDFHKEWYDLGYLNKGDIRLWCLTDPKELAVNVMPVKLKNIVCNKLDQYKEFVKDDTRTDFNAMTLVKKIDHIRGNLLKPNTITRDQFHKYINTQACSVQFPNFNSIFPEFKMAGW